MQVDFSGQQARRAAAQPSANVLRMPPWPRCSAGAAGLIFSFAMGLQDAGWSEAWTGVGHAYTLFSSPERRGTAAVTAERAAHKDQFWTLRALGCLPLLLGAFLAVPVSYVSAAK